jgi:hypothetical protein
MWHRLDDPEAWRKCASRMTAYLHKHVRVEESSGLELVACTVTQLRNKLSYETRILQPSDADFEKAHAERQVRAMEFDDGDGPAGRQRHR